MNTKNLVFGRLPQSDERNRNFMLTSSFSNMKERSYTWPLKTPLVLDQGSVGCCVATAFGYWLALVPQAVQGVTVPKLIEKVYWEAQKIDPFPGGDYPGAVPKSSGTSILAGTKVVQRLGYFSSYLWAFSAYDLALGVGATGPAVIGVNWYSGMMQPDKYARIKATGNIVGGHAICVRGVSFKNKEFLLQNSWGKDWGANGCALISFTDMDKLLAQNGDAVFPQKLNAHMLTF